MAAVTRLGASTIEQSHILLLPHNAKFCLFHLSLLATNRWCKVIPLRECGRHYQIRGVLKFKASKLVDYFRKSMRTNRRNRCRSVWEEAPAARYFHPQLLVQLLSVLYSLMIERLINNETLLGAF